MEIDSGLAIFLKNITTNKVSVWPLPPALPSKQGMLSYKELIVDKEFIRVTEKLSVMMTQSGSCWIGRRNKFIGYVPCLFIKCFLCRLFDESDLLFGASNIAGVRNLLLCSLPFSCPYPKLFGVGEAIIFFWGTVLLYFNNHPLSSHQTVHHYFGLPYNFLTTKTFLLAFSTFLFIFCLVGYSNIHINT